MTHAPQLDLNRIDLHSVEDVRGWFVCHEQVLGPAVTRAVINNRRLHARGNNSSTRSVPGRRWKRMPGGLMDCASDLRVYPRFVPRRNLSSVMNITRRNMRREILRLHFQHTQGRAVAAGYD
jgi:hypothetical protein